MRSRDRRGGSEHYREDGEERHPEAVDPSPDSRPVLDSKRGQRLHTPGMKPRKRVRG